MALSRCAQYLVQHYGHLVAVFMFYDDGTVHVGPINELSEKKVDNVFGDIPSSTYMLQQYFEVYTSLSRFTGNILCK